MSTVVEVINLIKSDPVNNNNKFWRGTLFANGEVLCEWGRVGDTGQSLTKPGGKAFLDSKVKEKMRDGRNGEIGYRKIDVIDGGSAPSGPVTISAVKSNLNEIAKKQIMASSKSTEVSKLIDRFVKENAHQITTMTGGQITYNYDKGSFQTPLGLVSQSNIDEARNKLSDISNVIVSGSFDAGDNSTMMNLTRDYLMLVPQDTGRRRLDISEFWSDLNKVQRQNAILDGLEASLASATKQPVKNKAVDAPEEKIFDVQVDLVTDAKVIDTLRKTYKKTNQSRHACAHLDVKQVFKITINTVHDEFQRDGAKMSNIWDLWHGTRVSNLLSILKGGLIIPPSNASNVTGRMFGNGIYASDQSTKALNYAYGYWGNKKADNNCFMFMLKMAMGSFYVPPAPFSANKAPKGFDSTFAQAQKSGVMNNEMIVYRTSQVDLRYLVEFSPYGK